MLKTITYELTPNQATFKSMLSIDNSEKLFYYFISGY